MAAIKAVSESEQDPKAGKPRPKSGTRFPYYDLADAVVVGGVVLNRGGGNCDRSQLATFLGHKTVNSGAFLTRISAAKMFGLIESTPEFKLRLTPRGKAIISPISSALVDQAKLDAFFAVELFQKVFQQFNGTTLPEDVGLQNLLKDTYGVVQDRAIPTVRIMKASAEYAGLFKVPGNQTKMVLPIATGDTPTPAPVPSPENKHDTGQRHGGGGNGGDGGNGSGDDGVGIDPAFLAMLRRLPNPSSPLSEKRRKTAIEAFSNLLDLVYPET